MEANREDFSTIMKCIDILFSSSEEEDDEEFLQLAILRERNKIPKLKKFVTVVREYSNNEVSIEKFYI